MNRITSSHRENLQTTRRESSFRRSARLVALIVLLALVCSGAASAAGVNSRPATTCTVTNTADSGPGTLRQCLLDAASGDTITFDVGVFPPATPATIAITSGQLPDLDDGNVTIDASNAGVILDGGAAPSGTAGLRLTSGGNRVMGLQILHFPGDGVQVWGNAQWNIIGGDRTTGSGPLGQGNLISGNGVNGVSISGSNTTTNTVRGNYIGTNISGTAAIGNGYEGIRINQASNCTIQGNVLSGNVSNGIEINPGHHNRVVGNLIGTDAIGTTSVPNRGGGIIIVDGSHDNIIGGDLAADRNIISGNDGNGVHIYDHEPSNGDTISNTISGNFIGTDISGTAVIPNSGNGVVSSQ